MKKLSYLFLVVSALGICGCGSGGDMSAAEQAKFKADLGKPMDMSKASPEQKKGFENYMKNRGGAPSAPSGGG